MPACELSLDKLWNPTGLLSWIQWQEDLATHGFATFKYRKGRGEGGGGGEERVSAFKKKCRMLYHSKVEGKGLGFWENKAKLQK